MMAPPGTAAPSGAPSGASIAPLTPRPGVAEDDPRLVYLPEADVLAASGMCRVLRDRWFSVHPTRGLMFWQSEKRRLGQLRGASPQCNSTEAIARALADRLYPWAETRFVPVVLLPIHLEDYGR